MSLRVYICPWIGNGTRSNAYRSKADSYYPNVRNYFPSLLNGPPASPWVLSVVNSNDFSAIDADPTCDDLFAGDLPASVNTMNDIVSFLRARTVADVPLARRNAITAVLDKYNVIRTDIVGSTPLWKVTQRVISTLMERDDNFGFGIPL